MMGTLHQDDIRRVLRICPKDIKTLLKEQPVFLAGGAIRDIIASGEISDWDMFGHSKDMLKLYAQAMVGSRKGRLWSTDNAYTVLSPGYKPVQFITRWLYSDSGSVAQDFDFTICSAVIWWQGSEWASICHQDFYADLAAKRLRYMWPKREEDAGGSMMRVMKFIKRGYSISPEDLGAVMSRITSKMRETGMASDDRGQAKIITGLLREVDPLTVIEGLSTPDGKEEGSDDVN